MFVLATMSVTLHYVLVSTVTGKLVAHPARGPGTEKEKCLHLFTKSSHVIYSFLTDVPVKSSWLEVWDSRAALDLHRSDLVVAPAHRLQRGVVIVDLPLASNEVLLLKQHYLRVLVVLWQRAKVNSDLTVHIICTVLKADIEQICATDVKIISMIRVIGESLPIGKRFFKITQYTFISKCDES